MSERKPYNRNDNDDARRGFIEAFLEHTSDFPDGAFWAYAEELGIDVGEFRRLGFAKKVSAPPTPDSR